MNNYGIVLTHSIILKFSIRLAHLGLPQDIADAAYYVIVDAAKYIKGIIMRVDGGNSIGF